MITWIRENTGLFSLAASLVLVISTVAVTRYQIAGLMAAQPEIQSHIHDTTRHIDPVRDSQREKQLETRIERLEEQIRRMDQRGWRRQDRETVNDERRTGRAR